MTTTRARPLTNAERQRRYRARRAAEYRQAVAEGRTVLHQYCRELVGDPDRAAWLVANGMTYGPPGKRHGAPFLSADPACRRSAP